MIHRLRTTQGEGWLCKGTESEASKSFPSGIQGVNQGAEDFQRGRIHSRHTKLTPLQ